MSMEKFGSTGTYRLRACEGSAVPFGRLRNFGPVTDRRLLPNTPAKRKGIV